MSQLRACTVCGGAEPEMLLCTCEQHSYCSEACADKAWSEGHALDHSEVKLIEAMTPAQRQKFYSLVTNQKEKNKILLKLIQKVYKPSAYSYQVRHQDNIVQPRMNLDPSENRLSLTVRTPAQRLCSDFDGPWNPLRGGIRIWTTGAGKTALIQTTASFYRQEEKESLNLVTGLSERRPRICLFVTELSLQQNMFKDIWAQNDANREFIAQRIEDAGLLSSKTPSSFNIRHVVTARKLTNMLQGIGETGRRLWMGKSPSESGDALVPGLNAAPTAYRLVEGQWICGNRPWSEEKNNGRTGVSRFAIQCRTPIKNFDQIQEDLKGIANFPYMWKGATHWKKNVEAFSAELLSDRKTIKASIKWSNLRQQPSDENWNYFIETPDYLLARLRNLPSLKSLRITKVYDWGHDRTDDSEFGYKLILRNNKPTWVHLDEGEHELQWNPCNNLVLFVDEAQSFFEPHNLTPGERGNIELLKQVLKDCPGMKIFYYSATVNLSIGMQMLETLNSNIQSFGSLRSLTEAKSKLGDLIEPVGVSKKKKSSKSTRTDDEEDEEDTRVYQFSAKGVEELANKAKGLISVVKAESLQDYFAEVIVNPPVNYTLSEKHAEKVLDLIQRRRTVASIQATLMWEPGSVEPQYRLNDLLFSPDAIVQAVLDGKMPSALPMLRQLRENDAASREPRKQGVTSSIIDDVISTNLNAAVLQAFGYQWLPIERNTVDESNLSAEDKKEIKRLRNAGLPIPKRFRTLRFANQPKTGHSTNAEALQTYGPLKPAASNTFVVLSTSLINKDTELDEPENQQLLIQQMHERGSLDTRFAFFNTIGQLREKGLNSGADEEALREFRRSVKGHNVYLWPGKGSHFTTTIDTKAFADKEEPVWFIRRREMNDEKEEIVYKSVPINEELLKFTNKASVFEAVQALCEFNVQLSEDEKQDMLAEVTELFNSPENAKTLAARIILFGGSFTQGFDIYDTPYVVNTDVAIDDANRVQRAGRYNRRNGMPNIPFEERKLLLTTLVARWPSSVAAPTVESVIPSVEEQIESTEQGSNESDTQYEQRLRNLEKRLRKKARTFGILVYEKQILNNIEGEPLKNNNVEPGALTETYALAPYEALRVLQHDPFLNALNIAGSEQLSKLAFDRDYTTPKLDSDSQPSYAFSNWSVNKSILELFDAPVYDDSFLKDLGNPANPIRQAALRTVPTLNDLPEQVKKLVLDDETVKFYQKYDAQSTAVAKVRSLLELSPHQVLVFRRLSRDPQQRGLYLGVMENDEVVATSIQRLNLPAMPQESLMMLFERKHLTWSPNFGSVARSSFSSGRKRPNEGDATRKKRAKTPADSSAVSTTELGEELEMFQVVDRYITIGAEGDEEPINAKLYSNVLDASPFADDEHENIEALLYVSTKTQLQSLEMWAPLADTHIGLLKQLYLKRMNATVLPRTVDIKYLLELRFAVVELYKYGVMRWARALELLARVYLSNGFESESSFISASEIVGPLFQISDTGAKLLSLFPTFAQDSHQTRVRILRFLYHWTAAYSPVQKAMLFRSNYAKLDDILQLLLGRFVVDLSRSIKVIAKALSGRTKAMVDASDPNEIVEEIVTLSGKKLIPKKTFLTPGPAYKQFLQNVLAGLPTDEALQEITPESSERRVLYAYLLKAFGIPRDDTVETYFYQFANDADGFIKSLIQHVSNRADNALHRLNALLQSHTVEWLKSYMPIRKKQTKTAFHFLDTLNQTIEATGLSVVDTEELVWLLQSGPNTEPLLCTLREDFEIHGSVTELPNLLRNNVVRVTGPVGSVDLSRCSAELGLPKTVEEQGVWAFLYRREWSEAQALIDWKNGLLVDSVYYPRINPTWKVERLEILEIAWKILFGQISNSPVALLQFEDNLDEELKEVLSAVIRRDKNIDTFLDWLEEIYNSLSISKFSVYQVVVTKVAKLVSKKKPEARAKYLEKRNFIWQTLLNDAMAEYREAQLKKLP